MSAFDAFHSVQDHVCTRAQVHIDRSCWRPSSQASTPAEDEEARKILGWCVTCTRFSVIEDDKGVVRRAPAPIDRTARP